MSFHAELTERFAAYADQDRAASMVAYMKGHFEFYGIPSTQRKELTRAAVRASGMLIDAAFDHEVRTCWTDPHREVQYSTQELLARKKWFKRVDAIQLIEWMIVTRSWWDTVDIIAASLAGGYFQQHPDKIGEVIGKWNASRDLWMIRSSLLFQLKYQEQTDNRLLESLILPHLDSNEFFIQKAIGWALRQSSKFEPEFVRSFVQKHPLHPVSLREAKKYI